MIRKIVDLLSEYSSAIYKPPFGIKVHSNEKSFLHITTLGQRVWRRLKRDLALLITYQFFLQREKIPTSAKKVLYVYLGTPQLGDSIMDLSARTLWRVKELNVDLFTHKQIANFYYEDSTFSKILTNKNEIIKGYDFIVLQSLNWKCLKIKWRFFFRTPFLALHGHFYGPEFNRYNFSRDAWLHVLDLTDKKKQFNTRPVFNLKLNHSPIIRNKRKIALSLGGVTSWRTYDHWLEFVKSAIVIFPDYNWSLIGSNNGLKDSEMIMDFFIKHTNLKFVENLVGHSTLSETFEILKESSLFVGADGGLMHMAKAAKTPILGLMAGPIHPLMRFNTNENAYIVHAPNSVNEISPFLLAGLLEKKFPVNLEKLEMHFVGNEPDCN